MSDINNGGPAFPCDEYNSKLCSGMTLRDYFASKAMQGLLAQSYGSALESNCAIGAEYAYRMADAMLAAREVKS